MRHTLSAIFTLLPIILFAGSVDSLRTMLARKDSSAVQAYYEIGKSFYPKQIDSTYAYYSQGISLAESINDYAGLATILRSQGVVKSFNGQSEAGIKDLERALKIIETKKLPPIKTVNTLINLGVTYHKLGQTGKFLEYNIAAEKIAREHGLKSLHKKVQNNMAVAYRVLKEYDDAIRIYNEVLNQRIAENDSLGIGNIYHNLSMCYSFMKDHKKTIGYSQQALNIFEAIGKTADHNVAKIAYGDALVNLERYDEAIPVFESAKSGDMSKADLGHYASLYIELSRAYTETGRYKESAQTLDEIKDHILDSDLESYKGDYFLLQSKNLKNLNKLAAAYDALDKYIAIQSQLNSQENIEKQQEMEVKYLALEKDLEIERQNISLEQSRKQKIGMSLGLAGLGAISLLLFQFLRLRKRNNLVLADKNRLISKTLEEKETLLNEIHHRVKNNLQVISSLLSLQSRKVKDKGAYEALQESQNRVKSMALIHQNFYQVGNHVSVNASEYIAKLADGLIKSYQISDEQIKIHADIDDINLDVDSIIPLGLIINELISNSLKHGAELDHQLEISVIVKKQEDGLRLEVLDNGKGLPANFDIDKTDSLGYRLIRSFSNKLKAQLNISGEAGTHVSLSIPQIKML